MKHLRKFNENFRELRKTLDPSLDYDKLKIYYAFELNTWDQESLFNLAESFYSDSDDEEVMEEWNSINPHDRDKDDLIDMIMEMLKIHNTTQDEFVDMIDTYKNE